MDGTLFSEQEFYLRQQQQGQRWRSALACAAVLHVLVYGGAMFLPSIFDRKPILDEVVTVDLVSMPEPVTAPPQPVPPSPAPEPEPTAAPEPEPEPVPDPPEIAVAPEPEPLIEAKPISVAPQKRKIQKAKDTRLAEEREQEKQRLARERKKREVEKLREQMRREQQLAQLKQDQQRAEAEVKRRQAELAAMRSAASAPPAEAGARSQSSGRKQVESLVLQQYLAALHQRVRSYWILPEMRSWDNRLEAVVVLKLTPDGRVVDTLFEHRSGDRYFDEFVQKTIASATPMPPFPRLLKESSLEVGFRFRPGELSM